MRILIAEDDAISRSILRKTLGSLPDIELVEAVDGQEAWRLMVQGLTPDLCLLDNQMPFLNGVDVLEKMRQEPRLRQVMVMICSSASDRTTVARAARLRIRDYILKPFQPAALFAKIEAVRKEMIARATLEDPATVCARLNLTEEAYRKQLGTLVHRLNATLAGLCLAWGQTLRATPPLTPLKQGCADLGVNVMLTGLANLETALQEAGSALVMESWPPPAGWSEKLQPLLATIETLRVGTHHLLESVGPLPPPEPEPAPAPEPAAPTAPSPGGESPAPPQDAPASPDSPTDSPASDPDEADVT